MQMEATTPEIVGEFQRFQTLRNNSQQNVTTRNNMQQGVQTDATCNIQHCCAVCSGLYVPVHFFPLPLIFTLVAASIPHFLTHDNFHVFPSNETGRLCFYLSL